MQGLAFDWGTSNLYAVTDGGYVLACDPSHTPPFTCATVLSNQGDVEGIAVNPVEGYIFQSVL